MLVLLVAIFILLIVGAFYVIKNGLPVPSCMSEFDLQEMAETNREEFPVGSRVTYRGHTGVVECYVLHFIVLMLDEPMQGSHVVAVCPQLDRRRILKGDSGETSSHTSQIHVGQNRPRNTLL